MLNKESIKVVIGDFNDIEGLDKYLSLEIVEPNIDWYMAKMRGDKRSIKKDTSLLSVEEEKAIFIQYNYYKNLYLNNNDSKILDLIFKIRDKIVYYNVSLVINVIEQYLPKSSRGLDFSDYISEGNKLLLDCIESFNPLMNYKFSTYLTNSLWRGFNKISKNRTKQDSYYHNSMEDSEILDDVEYKSSVKMDMINALSVLIQFNGAELSDLQMNILRDQYLCDTRLTFKQMSEKYNLPEKAIKIENKLALNKLKNKLEK